MSDLWLSGCVQQPVAPERADGLGIGLSWINARPVNMAFDIHFYKPMLYLIAFIILLLPMQGTRREAIDLDSLPAKRVRIPSTADPNLRQIVREHCGTEIESGAGNVRSWFDAMPILLGNGKKALLVWATQQKGCLTGADNRWIWILLRDGTRYDTVLFDQTLGLTFLRRKSHNLRDIRTDMATAAAQYTRIYRFNGRRYVGIACWYDAFVTPKRRERHKIPCRTH